ncbi:ABC transporter permease [Virgibacillus sp. W0430]|uniref:ABC transporter permease n=1 Tax=Virgibacillus sp. W0430 TaxID=3391580 RepID=UPI003F4590E7
MSIMENIKMAFSSLRAHKMRSILTMLGIIIGVGSVIAVVAIGQGGEAVLKSQIVGESNTIELMYMPSDEEIQSNPNIWLEDPFTQKDIDVIKEIPEVWKVVATSSEMTTVRFREETTDGSITGINQAFLDVRGLKIAKGRNLIGADFLSGSRAAIVSESFQEELLDGEEILGEVIYIGSQPVEVVGVLESETGFLAFNSNEVYLPQKTWQSVFAKTAFSEVSIQTKNPEDLQIAGEKASDLLNRIHEKEDAYQIINMEEIAEGIGKITGIMTTIIGSIAGVSLLVGGIGVMNIMLVSVTERTREIGVRMSLGATRGQILFQFLIESITLTLIGGIIGMVLGTGAALLVSHFAGWPPLVSLPVIIGGILFSMVIGVIFGILPANKASRLDPIESLRYE